MFQFSTVRRSCPFTKSFLPAAVIALITFMPGTSSARAAAPALAPAASASAAKTMKIPAPADQQPVQVADEIIRRLRRLGINVNPARLARPYDGEGELC